jgi:transposase
LGLYIGKKALIKRAMNDVSGGDLNETQWAALSLVFENFWAMDGPGPVVRDWRMALEAAMWIAINRKPWRHLPSHYGKWNTHYLRFQKWSTRGFRDFLHQSVWRSLLNCYEDGEDFFFLEDFRKWLRSEQTAEIDKQAIQSALLLLDDLASHPQTVQRSSGRRPRCTAPMPHLSQYPLTPERWTFIEIGACNWPKLGRPSENGPLCAAGILWLAEHGEAWKNLPPRFGPQQRVRRQFWRWTEAELWDILWSVLENKPWPGYAPVRWEFHGYNLASAHGDPGLRAIIEAFRIFASVQQQRWAVAPSNAL